MRGVGDVLRRLLPRRPGPALDVVRNPSCDRFEVDCWQLSALALDRIIPRVGVQPFPLHEILLMTAAVARLRPPLVFEWGTHVGKSAWIFRESLSALGIASHVHSIDLPAGVVHAEHPGRRRGELVRGLRGVTLHEGDGLEVALRLWAASGRPARPLFFLDGDHALESVRREIGGISETVPDAAILLHDTFFQDADSGYNVGPHQALQEALARHPGRWEVIHSGMGLPGMTLLSPRSGEHPEELSGNGTTSGSA